MIMLAKLLRAALITCGLVAGVGSMMMASGIGDVVSWWWFAVGVGFFFCAATISELRD